MKHLEHTLETYVYNYYMCNILIYFCIINIQHLPLKHLKHTLATCAFSVPSTCCLDKWRLVDAELDVTEWGRRYQQVGGCAGRWAILVLLAVVIHTGAAGARDGDTRAAARPHRRGPHPPHRGASGGGVPLRTKLPEHKILKETVTIVPFLETDVAAPG
jgi:hypothetical protein